VALPTLADAKEQLNLETSADDDLLARYLGAARGLVEARTGPLEVTTFTEDVETRAAAFLLSHRPIVSITSVTTKLTSWPVISPTSLTFDAKSGIVYRTDLGTLAGAYTVTYTAGWATCPDTWHLAVLVTVEHLWKMTRGGSRRPSMGGPDMLATRQGHPWSLPPAALELLSDGPWFGGIA